VVVSPLPEQTIDSSLYTEGTGGIRVLSTRYRARAVREDTREEVRAIEQKLRELAHANETIERGTQVAEQNLQLLAKLENFTSATMNQLMEKGMLNGEATIALSKYLMDTRARLAAEQVAARQQVQENQQAAAFAQRQLAELTAGANRTLRDAVITVDKGNNDAAGTVRLNYLVSAATWTPQYKIRAGREADPVQVEYLAAVVQQSGEDWSDVAVTLSTAEPSLNAAPPELMALDVDVTAAAPAAAAAANAAAEQLDSTGGKAGPVGLSAQSAARVRQNYAEAQQFRQKARDAFIGNRGQQGWAEINTGAALEQTSELLGVEDDTLAAADADAVGGTGGGGGGGFGRPFRQGPSVTYHLKARLTVPSRNDQQLIEVARVELKPDYFYKAVPVLTPHVYRLATLVNASEHVLLPGEATMYQGGDFVGRMNVPLVAIGEQFTLGFGVDPQIQATREQVAKSRAVQGGNQVHAYEYRIRVSSFKQAPVTVQVWDRLPRAEAEAVGVSLVETSTELSKDAAYLRAERPQNLLRWDLTIAPGTHGEKAANITYDFRLEYDRNVAIADFKARR
jgi:hypothetical protein